MCPGKVGTTAGNRTPVSGLTLQCANHYTGAGAHSTFAVGKYEFPGGSRKEKKYTGAGQEKRVLINKRHLHKHVIPISPLSSPQFCQYQAVKFWLSSYAGELLIEVPGLGYLLVLGNS